MKGYGAEMPVGIPMFGFMDDESCWDWEVVNKLRFLATAALIAYFDRTDRWEELLTRSGEETEFLSTKLFGTNKSFCAASKRMLRTASSLEVSVDEGSAPNWDSKANGCFAVKAETADGTRSTLAAAWDSNILWLSSLDTFGRKTRVCNGATEKWPPADGPDPLTGPELL